MAHQPPRSTHDAMTTGNLPEVKLPEFYAGSGVCDPRSFLHHLTGGDRERPGAWTDGSSCQRRSGSPHIRAGDRIFRTYFTSGRGDEVMASTWELPRSHCAGAPVSRSAVSGGVGRPSRVLNFHDVSPCVGA